MTRCRRKATFGIFCKGTVVCKGTAVLKLLTSKDQMVLVRRDALLVLDLGVLQSVILVDLKSDGPSGQRLEENQGTTTRTVQLDSFCILKSPKAKVRRCYEDPGVTEVHYAKAMYRTWLEKDRWGDS